MDRRLRFAIVFLIINATVATASVPVLAVPQIPCSFYGTVKINGGYVPDGTVISAWIKGVRYATTQSLTYNGASVYAIDVPGDDSDTPAVVEGGLPGDAIEFRVGNATAPQSATWAMGTATELNLTVSVELPTLTPTETASPTLTRTPTRTQTPTPVGGVATVTVAPAADSWINAWSGGSNYGSDVVMKVRTAGIYKSVVQFPLPSEVSAKRILSATLRFYVTYRTNVGIGTVSVFRLKRAWGETAVTWNSPWATAGAAGTTDIDSAAVATAPMDRVGSWYEIDVTSAVQAWASGIANYGLLLSYDSNTSTEYHIATRHNASVPPALEITYERGTTAATATPTNTATRTDTRTATPTRTNTPGEPPVDPTDTNTPTPTATATRTATALSAEPSSTPGTTTVTMPMLADSWMNAWAPTATHGYEVEIAVRTGGIYKSVLKPELPAGLAGSKVKSAQLRLYVKSRSNAGTGTLRAFLLKRNWDEGTVNWNTPWASPGAAASTDAASTLSGSAALDTLFSWVTIDVTSAVQAWADGATNYGLLLDYTSGTSTEYRLGARHAVAYAPSLVIQLTAGAAAEPTQTPTRTPTKTVGPSPTFTATATRTATRSGSITTDTMTFALTADSWMSAWSPTALHGGDIEMAVRTGGIYKAMLQADLPGELAGKNVVNATLKLYVKSRSNSGVGTLRAFMLKKAWSEDTANWNVPWGVAGAGGTTDVDSTPSGSIALGVVNAWITVDITAAVRAWASGTPNYGLLLDFSSVTSTEYRFGARHFLTYAPEITVTYETWTAAAAPPASIDLRLVAGWNISGQVTLGDSTPAR